MVFYPVVAVVLHVCIAWWLRLYRGRARIGSFQEASLLALVVAGIGFVCAVIFLGFVPLFPRGVAFTVPLGALALMGFYRVLQRQQSMRLHHSVASGKERVLIYGAGNAGGNIGQLLLFDPETPYDIVGYIDDDPDNRNLRLAAGRVLGAREDVPRLAAAMGVHTVLVAIPSASPAFIDGVTREFEAHQINTVVMPTLQQLAAGRVSIEELQEAELADLMGGGPAPAEAAVAAPPNERIFLSSPDVGEAEEAAIVRAVRSGWVAPLGPELDAFEAELAEYTGRRHCVALSSGTAALHMGLVTLGIKPGDLVLTSTMTFAATANAIMYTGAEPVFVGSDDAGNMDPDQLEQAFKTLSAEGREVSAVMPVDLLGKVVDHERIGAIADAYGVPVISDAAESLGAIRNGRSSAAFGEMAAVSFNGNKIMTTSGGGALLTDDPGVATHVRYLASQARQPVVHYEHTDIGYNYRMSNQLAALGRAQLARLPEMIERRRLLRLHYRDLFAGVPGVSIFGEPSGADGGDTQDNFWLTSVLVDPELAGFTSEDLRLALLAEQIESRPLWKPMHLQPVYSEMRSFVDATGERLFRTGLSLPSGSVLKQPQIDRIDAAVNSFLAKASVHA
ncbi:aminotransferase class I/II-fold pyridoxal phosphate-dependent enzyme [Propionibacteriaceae bacterium G57]|uniref:aminotransferase class I/II-fold pyridoxal phosphate-dependent enzyme n=1 Tax=Aestuariimicrobium sp. G57 TaxID=3418485 RepID=UPI003DA71F2B